MVSDIACWENTDKSSPELLLAQQHSNIFSSTKYFQTKGAPIYAIYCGYRNALLVYSGND